MNIKTIKQIILLCCLLTLGFCPSLWAADEVAVAVQFPISYNFDKAKDKGKFKSSGTNGLIISAVFPGIGSFGLDTYDVSLKSMADAKISILLLNYIYEMQWSLFKLGLGFGYGSANLKGVTYASQYQRAAASQYIMIVSVPLTSRLGAVYSLHSISAQPKHVSQNIYLEAGGTMQALGLSLSF